MKTTKTTKAGKILGVVKSALSDHVGEWKGKKTLTLDPDNKFRPMTFGPAKAKLILANIPLIQEFVNKYGQAPEEDGEAAVKGKK
jgi:hypothetical protein